ncbi:MAG: hypothetical protein COA78_05850 [Blastopirellula sp.]|nr:MAG: hypothetical protein COA78_05850 [Blastopirellula sp.]
MPSRIKIAVIAVLCLTISAAIYFLCEEGSSLHGINGALVKVGAVMVMLWLAYPQLEKLPAWLAMAIGAGAIVVAVYRKLALIIIPLLFVIWLIRPRDHSKKKKRAARSSPRKKSNSQQQKSTE